MRIIQIEPTNQCFEKCWYCPRWGMTRPIGFMSDETIEKMIKFYDNSQEKYEVMVCNCGEATLHPKFFEIMTMLKNIGMETTLFTAGSHLSNELIEKLANSDLHTIFLSYNRFNIDNILEEALKKIENVGKVKRFGIVAMNNHLYKSNFDYLEKRFSRQYLFVNRDIPLDKKDDGTFLCRRRDGQGATLLWNGDVVSCYFDFNGLRKLGTIDDTLRGTIKSPADVKGCLNCSYECKTVKY